METGAGTCVQTFEG